MPTRRRKIELHKLTISGLGAQPDYAAIIVAARAGIRSPADTVLERAAKSHALHLARIVGHDLRLRFMSYTGGHRPDILDTDDFSIGPNPLPRNTTGVEWTHVVGRRVGTRYILAIERFQAGIWPTTIEQYLQWLIDRAGLAPRGDEGPTVSIEAVPGQQFIQRLDALQKVTKATVRTVRPNPGWHDLQTEMAAQSQESDAHKAAFTLTARRNRSLSLTEGIVAAIKRLFGAGELDYAAIEGHKDGKRDHFNTENLGRSVTRDLTLDGQGQVAHDHAWRELGAVIDEAE